MNEQPSLKKYLERHQIDKSELSILIDKSDYTLSVLQDGKAIKTFNVVFGGNPIDDKRMEGDGCTPEGVFSIRNLYPHKKVVKVHVDRLPNGRILEEI
jgi:murein L,D-transpeptidase YafK